MVKKLVSRAEFARQAGVSGAAVTKACNSILKDAVDGKRLDANHPSAVAYLEEKVRAQTPAPATGLDNLYEDAVVWCNEQGRYSTSSIQRHFKIGYNRASAIMATMRANGLIPAGMDPLDKTAPPATQKKADPVVTTPAKPHVRGTAAAKEARKRQPPPEEREGTIDIPEDIQAFADFTLRELIEKFGTDTRFVDWLSATQKIEAINEKRLKNAQTKGELISRELVRNGVIDTFNAAHLRLLKDGAKSIAAGVISKHSGGAELSEVEAYVSDILGSFIKPVKGKITRVLKNA